MEQRPYQNALVISSTGKGIPYGGWGAVRPDGGANHGYKNLKGQPERLDEIPELREDPALREVIGSINRPETKLFSVGCVSSPFQRDDAHGVTGYIEFGIDSALGVTDAANYFPIFFHFDRFLRQVNFNHRVGFTWELMGAQIWSAHPEIGSLNGFTASIIVNAGLERSPSEAQVSWEAAMDALSEFLPRVVLPAGRRICPLDERYGETPEASGTS